MIKVFCDGCMKEIPSTANRGKFSTTLGVREGTKVEVEVMVSINGTANNGHICAECIVKTVNEGGFTKSSIR